MNNFVNFEGNLTKDPDYREIGDDNRPLAVFRIAINERISKDYEETLYIDVNAWGYHVPYCKSVSLGKGDRVTVRGRLQERQWQDKEGNKRYSMVVIPNNFSKIVKPSKPQNATSEKKTEETVDAF